MVSTPAWSNALLVGTTGMLSQAAVEFACRSRVALAESGLARLRAEAKGLRACEVDYHHVTEFTRALRRHTDEFGAFDLALLWIHSPASEAAAIAMGCCGTPGAPARVIRVLGRGSAEAGSGPVPVHCRVTEVILGARKTGDRWRWLTHEEISAGILEALERDCPRVVVGSLDGTPG